MRHHISRDHKSLVEGLVRLGKITITPLHKIESSRDKSLRMSSRDKSLDKNSRDKNLGMNSQGTSLDMSKKEMNVVMKMTSDTMMVIMLWRTHDIEEKMKVHWDPESGEGCIGNMTDDIGWTDSECQRELRRKDLQGRDVLVRES